jgi:putative transposase
MSYSLDLRKKVIEYVETKNSASEAAQLFSISERTIYNWLKKKKTNGSIEDKPPFRPWRKLNPEALSKSVEEHPDWTLNEFAHHFNSIPSTICEAFKRLKITRKKRPVSTKNGMKKNEKFFWQK